MNKIRKPYQYSPARMQSLTKPKLKKKEGGFEKILDYVGDKDKRALLSWMAFLMGGGLVIGYYLWLGINPALNFGQSTMLLMQAFVVGMFSILYLAYMTLSPAWAYDILGVNTDGMLDRVRIRISFALAKRSVAAQIFWISALMALWCCPFFGKNSDAVYWAFFTLLAGFSLTFLIIRDGLSYPDLEEGSLHYYGSILLIGVLAIGAVTPLIFIDGFLEEHHKKFDTAYLILMWLGIVCISAFLGFIKKEDQRAKWFVPVWITYMILYAVNGLSIPFRLTAYAIGIAEPHPVTLILSNTVCPGVKLALPKNALSCDGEKAGLLENVALLNQIGERWVIRYGDSTENIVFDGKGTVIRRDKAEKTKDASPKEKQAS